MKKTPWIIGAATACVVAVGGGGTAFAMSNVAELDVYGQQSTVRTFSQPTVADLLAEQGVEVKDTDLVLPGLDSVVTDGMDIQVVQRIAVDVTVDGVATEVLTTGDTVADALAETEYDAEGAVITPAPETALDATGAEVEVITSKTVTFKGQYGQDTFDIAALTVGDAMERLLGDIKDTDTANVPRDTLLEDGATYTVKRVREGERVETEKIPFETESVEDDSMFTGETKVKTAGKQGTKELIYKDEVVNGKVKDSELISEEITAEPVTEVILKGTKEKPVERPAAPKVNRSADREATSEKDSSSSSDSTSDSSRKESSKSDSSSGDGGASAPAAPSGGVWDRLAQCESGGNWSINTGNGFYGGLQFTHSTWIGFGGGKYANNAHQASRSAQIEVAKKVQAAQGWGAWPACTSKLGIR